MRHKKGKRERVRGQSVRCNGMYRASDRRHEQVHQTRSREQVVELPSDNCGKFVRTVQIGDLGTQRDAQECVRGGHAPQQHKQPQKGCSNIQQNRHDRCTGFARGSAMKPLVLDLSKIMFWRRSRKCQDGTTVLHTDTSREMYDKALGAMLKNAPLPAHTLRQAGSSAELTAEELLASNTNTCAHAQPDSPASAQEAAQEIADEAAQATQASSLHGAPTQTKALSERKSSGKMQSSAGARGGRARPSHDPGAGAGGDLFCLSARQELSSDELLAQGQGAFLEGGAAPRGLVSKLPSRAPNPKRRATGGSSPVRRHAHITDRQTCTFSRERSQSDEPSSSAGEMQANASQAKGKGAGSSERHEQGSQPYAMHGAQKGQRTAKHKQRRKQALHHALETPTETQKREGGSTQMSCMLLPPQSPVRGCSHQRWSNAYVTMCIGGVVCSLLLERVRANLQSMIRRWG